MFGQYSCFHKFQCLTAAYAGINANSNKHYWFCLSAEQFLFCIVLVLYRIAERLLLNK